MFVAVLSDAIEIYSTYVALNALKPVEVSADIRHRIEGVCVCVCARARVCVCACVPKRYMCTFPFFLWSEFQSVCVFSQLSCARRMEGYKGSALMRPRSTPSM